MKVAITHDYLMQYGGAERVLEALLLMFPEADIYTLMHTPDLFPDVLNKQVKATSFLDISFARKAHRFFIPFMPSAARSVIFKPDYDLVISATAGYAKGMRIPKQAFHLMYCHTPLRYAWEVGSYFSNPIFKTVFRPAFAYLKHWDYVTAQSVNTIIANSEFIATKIKKYYGRDSRVLYPSVDNTKFFFENSALGKEAPFYLAVGRLLHYKKFEFLIDCFANTNMNLKIVGTGPFEKFLKKKAAPYPNISFLGSISDQELRRLYTNCTAFLFPQIEDFGLVAAEAQSCGAPIIAYGIGGSREIVTEGETGVFFHEYSRDAFYDALVGLKKITHSRKKISESAARFSFTTFKQGILDALPEDLQNRYTKVSPRARLDQSAPIYI